MKIPKDKLRGERLQYYFVARAAAGRTTDQWPETYTSQLIRGFKPPAFAEVRGPSTWRPRETLQFSVNVEDGEFARKLTLFFREADQSHPWRSISKAIGRSGEFVFRIDASTLDPHYELLYYYELFDLFGDGSIWPDPWTDARYRVTQPIP